METILKAFYEQQPSASVPKECVTFGTSGHRGRSIERTFNAAHIYAITQAVVDYRIEAGYQGPLFLGFDTHALSRPAWGCALQVLAANRVPVFVELRLRITRRKMAASSTTHITAAQRILTPPAGLSCVRMLTCYASLKMYQQYRLMRRSPMPRSTISPLIMLLN